MPSRGDVTAELEGGGEGARACEASGAADEGAAMFVDDAAAASCAVGVDCSAAEPLRDEWDIGCSVFVLPARGNERSARSVARIGEM